MKRAQRRFHASIWPLIALVMAVTLVVAVAVREHPVPKGATPPVGVH